MWLLVRYAWPDHLEREAERPARGPPAVIPTLDRLPLPGGRRSTSASSPSARPHGKEEVEDYFLAGRSLGPFVFLMSLFGTNMTAFAILGSSGHAFATGS